MHNILILFIAIFLQSCVANVPPPPPEINHSPEVTRVVVSYSKKLKEELGLNLETSCLWENPYIDSIYLEYTTQDLRDISEARKLIVSVVEGFVKAINEDSLLHYEAARIPFSADDLVVQIHFESYFGKYVDPLYVERATLQGGLVEFFAFTAYNPNDEYWHYHVEPYWQSVIIAGIESEEDIPYFDKYSQGRVNSKMYVPGKSQRLNLP